MQSVMTVIGLMSGAGLEGIDVALVATDGERRLERRQSLTFPLTAEQRKSLSKAIAAGHAARIEQDLVAFCAEAVKHFLESFALARDAVALIGFQSETAGGSDLAKRWRGRPASTSYTISRRRILKLEGREGPSIPSTTALLPRLPGSRVRSPWSKSAPAPP